VERRFQTQRDKIAKLMKKSIFWDASWKRQMEYYPDPQKALTQQEFACRDQRH